MCRRCDKAQERFCADGMERSRKNSKIRLLQECSSSNRWRWWSCLLAGDRSKEKYQWFKTSSSGCSDFTIFQTFIHTVCLNFIEFWKWSLFISDSWHGYMIIWKRGVFALHMQTQIQCAWPWVNLHQIPVLMQQKKSSCVPFSILW